MTDTYSSTTATPSRLPPVLHPTEPLTAEEITTAVSIVRTERNLSPSVRFVSVTLHEPSRETVLNFKPGDPIAREAFMVLLDKTDGRTVEMAQVPTSL